MGHVRGYADGDAERLAEIMREADRQEVYAATGQSPLEALQRGVEFSSILCTIVDNSGEVAAIYGTVPDDDLAARVWLLGSDSLTHRSLRRQFLQECRRYVEVLNDQYPLLYNVIDARNVVHIRWLDWMGFTFIRTIPRYGYEGRPFMEFVRVKQNV